MFYIYFTTQKKGNKILIHTTTQINLQDITLSEISQEQRGKYCTTPFTQVIRIGKFIETESRIEATRGWRVGGWGAIV